MKNKLSYIYIGKDAARASHFEQLAGSEVKVAGSVSEAIKLKNSSTTKNNIVILFEKGGSVRADIPMLKVLTKEFNNAYIFLIGINIDPSEGLQYLKNGINDTISPNITVEQWNKTSKFISLHLKQLQQTSFAEEKSKFLNFKLPLWKRIFDIVFTSVALLFLTPIMLVVVIVLKLESKGPAIYRSKRVGSNYKVFDFLKFRSMYIDSESKLKEFAALNQYQQIREEAKVFPIQNDVFYSMMDEKMLFSDDFVIEENEFIKNQQVKKGNNFVKLENDPRITKTGKFIRKYSLDELPQLFNILRGEMSIVGNRPLPLYEAELLTSDEYIDRFLAPSGLTGLWQVEKRGGAGKLSAEERKQLDIYYARNFNFWMDIMIIFKTLTAFIQKENV